MHQQQHGPLNNRCTLTVLCTNIQDASDQDSVRVMRQDVSHHRANPRLCPLANLLDRRRSILQAALAFHDNFAASLTCEEKALITAAVHLLLFHVVRHLRLQSAALTVRIHKRDEIYIILGIN